MNQTHSKCRLRGENSIKTTPLSQECYDFPLTHVMKFRICIKKRQDEKKNMSGADVMGSGTNHVEISC